MQLVRVSRGPTGGHWQVCELAGTGPVMVGLGLLPNLSARAQFPSSAPKMASSGGEERGMHVVQVRLGQMLHRDRGMQEDYSVVAFAVGFKGTLSKVACRFQKVVPIDDGHPDYSSDLLLVLASRIPQRHPISDSDDLALIVSCGSQSATRSLRHGFRATTNPLKSDHHRRPCHSRARRERISRGLTDPQRPLDMSADLYRSRSPDLGPYSSELVVRVGSSY